MATAEWQRRLVEETYPRPIVGYGELVGTMQALREAGAVPKGVKLADGTVDLRPEVIRTDEHVADAALRGVLIVERAGHLELGSVQRKV